MDICPMLLFLFRTLLLAICRKKRQENYQQDEVPAKCTKLVQEHGGDDKGKFRDQTYWVVLHFLLLAAQICLRFVYWNNWKRNEIKPYG